MTEPFIVSSSHAFSLDVLRLILCQQDVLDWLTNEASKTSTPIDDLGVRLIKLILCHSS